MNTTNINTSNWPQAASVHGWARLLGYNPMTLYKHRKAGRLKATKKLNGQIVVTKQAICECFHLKT